jgi:hypothetical protein
VGCFVGAALVNGNLLIGIGWVYPGRALVVYVLTPLQVESYLQSNKDKGAFFGGSKLNATDASFAPKAYHALVALKHFKGFTLDMEKYPALGRYYSEVQNLPEWKKTDYGKEAIVKGWSKFF